MKRMRSWSTCRPQGDLHRVNSRPEVWYNWAECAAEKGAVANPEDRRDSDHALRLSATSLIAQGDQGIDMHGPPRRCPRRGKHDIRQQRGGQ
jgi:hypothetical protein